MKTRLNNNGVSTILSMLIIILFTGCNIVYDGNKGHAIISNKQGGSYSEIFYLETKGKGVGTPMTEKQMKDPSFIEKLNINSKTLNGLYWIIDKDGLPTLKL